MSWRQIRDQSDVTQPSQVFSESKFYYIHKLVYKQIFNLNHQFQNLWHVQDAAPIKISGYLKQINITIIFYPPNI